MGAAFSYFYDYYILKNPVDLPMYVYVLVHLLFIVPLNFFAYFLVYKSKNKSPGAREKMLKGGAIAMGLVMIMRYAIYYIYVYKVQYFNTIVKFEMSEIAMYLLILAIFFIKKQWFYPLAFVVGLLSNIAVVFYPYTVFSDNPPFHMYTVSSVLFHVLNGYMALMLITARGYTPRLKHLGGVLLGNIILFAVILLANRITGENFMALSDPSKLPIINNTRPPVNVIIIYLVFNGMSFAVFGVCELIYKRLHRTHNTEAANEK